MNFKKYFKTPAHSNFGSVALLLLRLSMGIAFVLHGSGKISTPFGWMPPSAPIPGFFQFLAAISEFGGGIALLLGLLTPLACFGIACTMAVATCFHAFGMGDPYVNMTGGSSFEPALGYLMVAILFMAMGPGKYSMDKIIFGERS